MSAKDRFVEWACFLDDWASGILRLSTLFTLFFVGAGMGLICLSISLAVTSLGFHNAREITGKVVSIRKADTLLPKLDVAVSWSDGGSDRQTVLRLAAGTKVQEGDSVKFLLRNKDQSAILPSQRRSLGRLAFGFILGVISCLLGAVVAESGQCHRWLSLWPDELLPGVVKRITGVPLRAEQPLVVEGRVPPVLSPAYSPRPAEEFTITAREKHGITVLDLTGVVGWNNWEILDRQLTGLLNAGKKSILLNLANLTWIGGFGQGMLGHFVDTARAAGGEIKFAKPSEQVRSGLICFADAVEIYPEEDEAAASFERNSTHLAKRAINLETETKEILKTERGPIIQVSFSGECPPGSAGNHVAGAMHLLVAKAVREFQPAGVIFDLSSLSYVRGDAISEIVMPLLRKDKGFAFVPNCVVAQGATAEALAPLMAPEFFFGIVRSQIFADVKQALDHLTKQPGLRPIQ